MGRRGPVGGRERALCVPRHGDGAACVRWRGHGTRSHQDAWAAPNSVEPSFCFLSAVMALWPLQDMPAQAGQGATDARKAPSVRVRPRTSKPGRELRAKCTMSS